MDTPTTPPGPMPQAPPHPAHPLDEIDVRILEVLAEDARTPNNAIAADVGIAPSTCLGRIRSLRRRGVLRGFHADLDPASLGRPLQALIAVRLQPQARSRSRDFGHRLAALPEVADVVFLAGADDLHVHIAVASTEEMRTFVVVHLSGDPDVASTETHLVFEHLRTPVVVARPRPASARDPEARPDTRVPQGPRTGPGASR